VQGSATTDDFMVVQERKAQSARCGMSFHAQGGDRRPGAWRSFWRWRPADHRICRFFAIIPKNRWIVTIDSHRLIELMDRQASIKRFAGSR
jgi:hypothetical protein